MTPRPTLTWLSFLLIPSSVLGVCLALGVSKNTSSLPQQLTAEQDHQRLMSLLHINSLRRGADGDPKSPNAANYDESKVDIFSKPPDALLLSNGKKVESAKVWWEKRRPEIAELFDREIYGRVPKNTPSVRWELITKSNEMNGEVAVVTKKLSGHLDNSAYPSVSINIDLTLSTPANATGPVPVIIEFALSPEVLAALMKRISGDEPPAPDRHGSNKFWLRDGGTRCTSRPACNQTMEKA